MAEVGEDERRLTIILFKALVRAEKRMAELSLDLVQRFERDRTRGSITPEASEVLDSIDISAGARILERLDELVMAGLPPALAQSVLQRMASHSQGWTMRTAYRFELEMEREALKAAFREKSAPLVGKVAGESMMRTVFEQQKAQGIATSVPNYPRRMVQAISENPHRSMWLLMAKKADGELEVPDTGAMRRDPDGVLRAFTDSEGRRILPDRIDLRAVSKWMDDVAKSTSGDIYSTCISGIMSGKGSLEIGHDLEEIRDTAPWRCRAMARTMRTETAAQADKAERERLEIKRYSFVCGLDERTCPVCGALDGHVFNVSEAKPGVNYPPMHPNCRCTTVSVPRDGEVRDVDGAKMYVPPKDEERAGYMIVRNADGSVKKRKYARVPASMTYPEWVKLQETLS